MWMGFGSTVSSQAQTYNATAFSPKMFTTTENCPLQFFNTTVKPAKEPFEPFTHLDLYDISYIWYSAIAWLWCLVVGLLISAFRPTDYRKVDKRLITPALTSMFAFYPKRVRNWIQEYYDDIGSALEPTQIENGPKLNKGFEAEQKF